MPTILCSGKPNQSIHVNVATDKPKFIPFTDCQVTHEIMAFGWGRSPRLTEATNVSVRFGAREYVENYSVWYERKMAHSHKDKYSASKEDCPN